MHILLCTEQTYVFWYQRSVLILRALFVSLYLHVLHLMECSCYCCLVIVVITILSYCYHCLLRTLVSSRLFRICRIVSSHVSFYARVILFSSPYPRLSISLCSSVSSREESHSELFPTPSSSDSRASYSRSKDRSKSIINPLVAKMYLNR